MSSLTPASPFDESDELFAPARSGMALAGWWPRVGAAVVDFFVRLAIVVVFVGIGALAYLAGSSAGEIGLFAGFGVGLLLTWFAYAPILLARWDGQTVGHRVADTRIVMSDGSRMSGGRAFVREALVKNLLIETIGGFIFILPILNYLWPLWDPANEALHDKICSTRVVPT